MYEYTESMGRKGALPLTFVVLIIASYLIILVYAVKKGANYIVVRILCNGGVL